MRSKSFQMFRFVLLTLFISVSYQQESGASNPNKFELAFDEEACLPESDTEVKDKWECGSKVAYNLDVLRVGIFGMINCERIRVSKLLKAKTDWNKEQIIDIFRTITIFNGEINRWNVTSRWRDFLTKSRAAETISNEGLANLKTKIIESLMALHKEFTKYTKKINFYKEQLPGKKLEPCHVPSIVKSLAEDFKREITEVEETRLGPIKLLFPEETK